MFVSPMLLHKAENNLPFNDDNWITSLKLDGIRLIYTRFNGITKIYTRHNNEITSQFKELVSLKLPDNIVLDGELIVTDDEGKPNFEWMMERFQSNHSQHKVTFAVFDILYFDGMKVTHLPLIDRLTLLEKVIPEDTEQITKVKWMVGNAVPYFELVKQHGLEGLIQKRADSKYYPSKRTHNWLKVISYQFASNIAVSGYRKGDFGLLLQFEDGSPAGLLEFMPKEDRKKFYQLPKIVQKETDKIVYIKPSIKIDVKYRNLTSNGLLRIPSFHKWTV